MTRDATKLGARGGKVGKANVPPGGVEANREKGTRHHDSEKKKVPSHRIKRRQKTITSG